MQQRLMVLLLLAATLPLTAAVTPASSRWISAETYARVQVILPAGAAPDEVRAADEFAQHWQQATGAVPTRGPAPANGALNVWLGRAATAGGWFQTAELTGLGDDGLRIRTAAGRAGLAGVAHLAIAGATPRGTLNGVYDFLETHLGVRWLGPDATHVPAAPAELPMIDRSYTPPFSYRYPNATESWPWDPRIRNRLTMGQVFGIFVHTAYTLLPPDEWYASHPEFYALRNGERRAPVGLKPPYTGHSDKVGQLCYSNPDLPEVLYHNLRERIRRQPEPRVWSVSQMDWDGRCECDRCQAIDKREGSPMGSLLTCVNAVADRLAAEYPGYFIETLAYQHTRQPPRQLRPRDNVIIRLCSIECDFSRPLDDPSVPVNASFLADLTAWRGVARHLHVWDYTANFRNYHTPHPNLSVLGPNVRLFARAGVEGVFEQGCAGPGGEFGVLRPYLLLRLLWNPALDDIALREEFLTLYYGPAAPFLREWITLTESAVRKLGVNLGIGQNGAWLTPELIREGRRLFNQALAAAPSEKIRRRVDEASLTIDYAELIGPPAVELTGDEMILRRVPSLSLEEYIARLKQFGTSAIVDGGGVELFREQIGGVTPPRERRSRLLKLTDGSDAVWIAPELEGALLRWTVSGRELFAGYRNYGQETGGSSLQDWAHHPGIEESAVASVYHVERVEQREAVISAQLPSGLEIRRRMRLDGANATLTIDLEIRNPTAGPLSAPIKIHPEFHLLDTRRPELWLHSAKQWARLDTEFPESYLAFGKIYPAVAGDRLVAYFPRQDLALWCEAGGDGSAAMLAFCNFAWPNEQLNLEVISQPAALEPGKTRKLQAVYRLAKGRPQVQP